MRKRHLASVALVVLPAIASAQWTFTPYTGAYLPTAKLGVTSQGSGGSFEARAGLMLGANAQRWFNDRFGFEAGAGYAWSDLKFTEATDALWDNAYVVLTNAKLLTRITAKESQVRMNFGVGPSVVFSGGNAYTGEFVGSSSRIERGTSVGGVASFGFDYSITQLVGLRLGADGYLYSAKVKVDHPQRPLDFARRFQTDLAFTGGLTFTLPVRSR